MYCVNADDKPVFLNAITYDKAGFVARGSQEKYNYSTTSLPPMYGWGSLALPFAPNYLYEGPKEGTKTELLAAFANPDNYRGSNIPYTINTSASNSVVSVVFATVLLVASFLLM